MSDGGQILLAVLFIALICFIIIILPGCAALTPAPDIITTPTSGFESVMKVVAKSNWVVTFCLLAFFSGVVTTAMDAKKIGISIIIASIMTLFLGLAVHRFPTWMAAIGFIGSAGTCVMVVLKRKKALVEIIKGVENFRDSVGKQEYLDSELRSEQSSSTKKIVKNIKAKICTSETEMS